MTTAMLLTLALATTSSVPEGPVVIEVEASDVDGNADSTMEEQLGQKLAAALSERGVTVSDAADRRVHVTVRRTDIIDYEVEVRVAVGEGTVESGVAPFSCESCRVVELQERVISHVPDIVAALDPPAEVAPDPAVGPPGPSEPSEPPPAASSEGDQPQRPLGAVGVTGAVVTAVGLGALTYGVVLLARGTTPDVEDGDDRLRLSESYTRPGWAWTGVGIGTAVAGAAMLVVDLTVLRQRRAQRVAVHPSVGLAHVGASVRFEF